MGRPPGGPPPGSPRRRGLRRKGSAGPGPVGTEGCRPPPPGTPPHPPRPGSGGAGRCWQTSPSRPSWTQATTASSKDGPWDGILRERPRFRAWLMSPEATRAQDRSRPSMAAESASPKRRACPGCALPGEAEDGHAPLEAGLLQEPEGHQGAMIQVLDLGRGHGEALHAPPGGPRWRRRRHRPGRWLESPGCRRCGNRPGAFRPPRSRRLAMARGVG